MAKTHSAKQHTVLTHCAREARVGTPAMILIQGQTGYVRARNIGPGRWQALKKIFAFSPERESIEFNAPDDADHATLKEAFLNTYANA